MKIYIRSIVISLLYFHLTQAHQLIAYVSQNGLHGEFYFSEYSETHIKIGSKLDTTLQYPDQIWSWGIHQFPVDYTNPSSSRCAEDKLGEQYISFDESLGYLTLPGNESSIWESELSLTGERGIWGKSLLLSNPDTNFRICATIVSKDKNINHIAEARFHSPVAGSIYFRWLTTSAKDSLQHNTLIYTNLFHVKNHPDKINSTAIHSQHSWKIYTTDVLDGENKRHDNCNVLQLLFDPQNSGKGKSIGDIDVRLGQLKIAINANKRQTKELYNDPKLILTKNDLTGPHRRLYIIIFDDLHKQNFLACAEIHYLEPTFLKAYINGNGIKGDIKINQNTKFEPTWLNFTITSSVNQFRENIEYAHNVSSYYVTTLPPDPVKQNTKDYCTTTNSMYNPLNVNQNEIPPPGFGTQDQYAMGDLTGKLQNRNYNYIHNYFISAGGSNELNGIYWDVFLPLQGPHSINNRGLIIEQFNRSDPLNITTNIWTCGTLILYDNDFNDQITILTAEVLYRYPIVGRILFRQPLDKPWLDTIILVEYLIHADGSTQNNSNSHRWAVHLEAPGKDFYDWQQRCISTKDIYNPYKVEYEKEKSEEYCNHNVKESCRIGDLSSRLDTFFIAGSKIDKKLSRKLFSDENLPLTGHHNIMGKSLVIYDDHGPKARGERLACSIISGHFRRKAVAKNWYSNGAPLTLTGKLEMIQQSEYDITNVEVIFNGLVENSGYQIHMVPVEGDLEFPCESTSLYGHYNPRNIDARHSPYPSDGTTDQYEMGDLSGKFGTLDNLQKYNAKFNDSNLPLYGYESILGRSIIIHKRQNNLNWACSTIERGYSPSEAREIRGIASFHHPDGYAFGYVRFTQLIHYDGSKSDTVIEVKLRHPGINDRNVTRDHHWNIFVNSIGVDATVEQTITRCVAGGYIWNPYYTQLADPLNGDLYRAECGADNPLRCYVGDVSARLGTIDIGDKRAVFSDPNFPLEGDQSAIGRSIVIFGANKSSERFACANIEPDHDILKYVNLRKPPKFVVAQFLDDVRNVMGIPEWMLSIDSRTTETVHNGGCVQLIMRFKGPIAQKIELDFARLIDIGSLASPSLYIPGYIDKKRKSTLAYRQCGVRDPNEKKNKQFSRRLNSGQNTLNNSLFITNKVWLIIFVIYSYL